MTIKKKTKSKQNSTKTNIILTIGVLVILVFMASGYALLNTKLTISGQGKLDIPEYKIFISAVKVNSTSNGGYQTSTPTFTDNEVALYNTLPNGNSSVVYDVTIQNTGASDAVVDYIYVSSGDAIKYRIIGVSPQETIKGLSNTTVQIEVLYSENASVVNESQPLMINFRFLKKTDSYSNQCTLNWDGSSSSEPIAVDIYGKSYYQITNANELNWFKNQVDSGNTSINAILDNDICMNGHSFSMANNQAYTGTFDGQNRTIEGLSYSRDVELDSDFTYNSALFLQNAGVIKNLNVAGNIYNMSVVATSTEDSYSYGYNYLGGIVANNSGVIENSSYSGTITANEHAQVNCAVAQAHNYTYVGGIAANNTGIIRGCVNRATFNLTGYATYSTCDIYTREVHITSGGIAGTNAGFISDSYNQAKMDADGSMRSTTRSLYVGLIGGVAGSNEKQCQDSYNSGAISQTLSGNTEGSAFGVIGANTGTVGNVYYLSSTANNGIGTEVNASDLTNLNITLSRAFLKSANYPKLFWEL